MKGCFFVVFAVNQSFVEVPTVVAALRSVVVGGMYCGTNWSLLPIEADGADGGAGGGGDDDAAYDCLDFRSYRYPPIFFVAP